MAAQNRRYRAHGNHEHDYENCEIRYLPDFFRSHLPMTHERVYRCFPPFWKMIGHLYREMDAIGGVFFILGSIGFSIIPIFTLYKVWSSVTLNILMIISVLLFMLAKLILESRAIYAALWKRPSRRQSALYHWAIWILVLGGILFLMVPALELGNVHYTAKAAGYCSLLSGWGFFIGSLVFTIDGGKQLKSPFWRSVENLYFWGSFMLTVGSVLFVYTGFCMSGAGSIFSPSYEEGFVYRPGSGCTDAVVDWLNGIGGMLFLVGSVMFLLFAVDERKEMRNGPDVSAVATSDEERGEIEDRNRACEAAARGE